MAKWSFSCTDNSGKHQNITVTAPDKTTAIKKGMERAQKHAAGDIGFSWNCRLLSC